MVDNLTYVENLSIASLKPVKWSFRFKVGEMGRCSLARSPAHVCLCPSFDSHLSHRFSLLFATFLSFYNPLKIKTLEEGRKDSS